MCLPKYLGCENRTANKEKRWSPNITGICDNHIVPRYSITGYYTTGFITMDIATGFITWPECHDS